MFGGLDTLVDEGDGEAQREKAGMVARMVEGLAKGKRGGELVEGRDGGEKEQENGEEKNQENGEEKNQDGE